MAYETNIDCSLLKGSRLFSIDAESIIFHDTQMMCNEVVAFSYGSTLTLVSGLKANSERQFYFRDSSGDEIEFTFYNTSLFDTNPKDAYDRIAAEIWISFGNRLKQEIIEKLSQGRTVELCELTITSFGITVIHKPVFGSSTDFLIPWEEMEYNVEEGILHVRSSIERKARTSIFVSAVNGQLLLGLLDSISQEDGVLEKIKRIKM